MQTQSTILIVEDDRAIGDVFGEILTDEGYRTLRAANGAVALAQLQAGLRPDLILLDLMMPDMDGWQFRAEQQRDPAIAHIPVIVITADRRAPHELAALHVAGQLRKPVQLDDLLALVARLLRAA